MVSEESRSRRVSLRSLIAKTAIALLVAGPAHAENILMIGDSLSCGPFGKHVVENLSQRGFRVTLYCAVSSAPIHWLKGKNPPGQICQTMSSEVSKLGPCGGTGQVPALSQILAKHKGSRVLVGLGTNSLMDTRADHSYRLMVETVASSGKCVWIGPPHLQPSHSKGFPAGRVATEEANLNGFYVSLFNSVEGICSLFDSREATASGTPGNETVDGIHRNDSAGKYWADRFTGIRR
jgi:hypothetical protein